MEYQQAVSDAYKANERPQHHYPRCTVGGFAVYDSTKVKVAAMRWDAVHCEFQYLVKSSFTDPGQWASEKRLRP
jgi:hypothetical protein